MLGFNNQLTNEYFWKYPEQTVCGKNGLGNS